MGAEFLVELPMLAFAEKVEIDLPHDDAIGIGVAGDLFGAVPPLDLKHVGDVALAVLQGGLEKTVAVDLLGWDDFAVAVEFD